jgi:hypothetical protein
MKQSLRYLTPLLVVALVELSMLGKKADEKSVAPEALRSFLT